MSAVRPDGRENDVGCQPERLGFASVEIDRVDVVGLSGLPDVPLLEMIINCLPSGDQAGFSSTAGPVATDRTPEPSDRIT